MVLLTGGTGFLGRRVALQLVQQRKEVRCLVRRSSAFEVLQSLPVEVWRGDVTDPDSLEGALDDVDTVIHLVAIIREKGTATFQRVNVEGTRNVVRAAQKAGVRRIIHMSVLGAGPDPRFPYLRSKWQGEEEVRTGGIPYTILRSGLMFGEGDEFFTILAELVRKPPAGMGVKLGPFIPVPGWGDFQFQPIAADEVARCILLALEREDTVGQTIPIGGPEHLSYNELLDAISQLLGKWRWKVPTPLFLMRPAVWAMNLVLSNPPVTPTQLEMIHADNITELDAVPRAFGFTPTRFRDGITYLAE